MKTLVKNYLFIFLVILLSVFSINYSATSLDVDQKNNIQLYVVDSGENQISDLSVFSSDIPKDTKKTLAIRCYIVKHPKGVFLWDTCLNDSLEAMPDGLKLKNGVMTLKLHHTLKEELAKIELKPENINIVSFSHMHPDHSGNANVFNNALYIMQNNEFDAAFSIKPDKYSFDKSLYKNIVNNKIKRISGNYDVFGDGSVVIMSAPGHTPGHQVLFVDLPQTGPILLAGDLYHFADNREHQRVPLFNYSKELTKTSMESVEQFVKDKNAKLWIQHDPEQEIKYIPEFYQ